jgi:hypothetical protein
MESPPSTFVRYLLRKPKQENAVDLVAKADSTSRRRSIPSPTQAEAEIGAGELAGMLGALVISTSAALTLFSLSMWLLSLFSLLLPPDEEDSASPLMVSFGGAFHRGISQMAPVKVLIWKLPFCHFRHGFPVRSSARRPALIAPWLALGPSLCPPAPFSGDGRGNPVIGSVPSSLSVESAVVSRRKLVN